MVDEFITALSDWGSLDSWIVLTAALAAMACAVPGNFLLLRKQSMMGDALSHSVLLGIAVSFLAVFGMRAAGIVPDESYQFVRHTVMFGGAIVVGILTALLSEAVRRLGSVESSAALGVVFVTLFAMGLLLIRLFADQVHLDPDCVLYGTVETAALDPQLAIINGSMLLVNIILVTLLFKELRISTFDPGLATALGFRASYLHYGLMAVTAATLVAAFETVGSILVIAMLIVPPATAYMLTQRLWLMVILSVIVAALSAALGHVAAITLPMILFSHLGLGAEVGASSAGMMAVASGVLFSLAVLVSPHQGVFIRTIRTASLNLRIACEDVLGILYRLDEIQPEGTKAATLSRLLHDARGSGRLLQRLAISRLKRLGQIVNTPGGYHLTPAGLSEAQNLVRTHRLWEAYLEKHFDSLSGERQHRSAHSLEHYIDPSLREDLAAELELPETDPHGRSIPPPKL